VVKEESYFAQDDRRRRVASPADGADLRQCRDLCLFKGLGALSRGTGLPRRPAASRFSSRGFPGELLKAVLR